MEIKFNNVSYAYNQNTPLEAKALQDISVTFEEEKIHGIVGKSGSGKTTMIELMHTLMLPTQGNIEVGSRVISQGSQIQNVNQMRYKVGLVFQFPEEQFFCSTVQKEIAFGMKYFKKSAAEIKKHISDALKMVQLDDSYLERDPFSLSSGEMRKVAIASVLAFNPKVIILDEPTIGLDFESKENLIKILKMLKKRYHKTVIIVTHDTDLLHRIADHIVILENGKLVLEGNKYEVFTHPSLEEYGVKRPQIIAFEKTVLDKKNIKLGFRDDINDLMKDVYRYVK